MDHSGPIASRGKSVRASVNTLMPKKGFEVLPHPQMFNLFIVLKITFVYFTKFKRVPRRFTKMPPVVQKQ